MTSTLALPAGHYFHTGEAPGREGNQHHTLTPYETMAVRDGLVVVAAGNQRLWRQFCAAVDSSDLLDDPRYATNTDRMRHRSALIDELSRRLGRFTCDELIARLRAHTVPCGQVRRLADALEDPHLHARAMVVEIPHDTFGAMRSLGNPIRLSRTPAVLDRPPPALGEHNAEILAALRGRPETATAGLGAAADPTPAGREPEPAAAAATPGAPPGPEAPPATPGVQR